MWVVSVSERKALPVGVITDEEDTGKQSHPIYTECIITFPLRYFLSESILLIFLHYNIWCAYR